MLFEFEEKNQCVPDLAKKITKISITSPIVIYLQLLKERFVMPNWVADIGITKRVISNIYLPYMTCVTCDFFANCT